MPKREEYCEVRTTGGVFRDWLSVTVAQSVDDAWMRHFTLIVAEPNKNLLQRLVPGTRVDVALAGKVVIQEGYIHTREAAIDAHRHAVRVIGYSKADLTTRPSVDVEGGQFRGYKVDAIANKVLKPYGIKFKVEGGPEGWDEKFPNVSVRYGETPFSLIERLCRQRGLWLRAEPNGDIIAGAKQGSSGPLFEEGRNILAANCTITMPSVASVVANSQMQGSDSLFGKKAAEIQAKTKIENGPPGTTRKMLAEMPLNQKEVQLRTNMEAAAINASMLRVQVTYQGWLRPDGQLWSLSDHVSVKSPSLFPVEGGQMELKLWGYAYNQAEGAGTTTTLELVNALAFQQKNPNAQQSDGFYNAPAPPPAQPENAT